LWLVIEEQPIRAEASWLPARHVGEALIIAGYRSEAVEYRVEHHFDSDGRAWVPKLMQSAPISRTIPSAA
jgi:hypothetical protein